MPSRFLSLVIVLFWLLTASWFVAREIWPLFADDGPPAYVIDVTDEAMRQIVPVRWELRRNGEWIAPMRTATEYRESDDSFLLIAVLGKFDLASVGQFRLTVRSLQNNYRVTRAGKLLATETDLSISIAGMDARALIQAEVRDGQAVPRCRVEWQGGHIEPELEPIPIKSAGVLNPLHPVNRIYGLRPGMQWRLPLVDPLADAQRIAVEGVIRKVLGPNAPKLPKPVGPQTLVAEVTGPRDMDWGGQLIPCYVIEYRGQEYSARTWVRVRDGAVMRQEASSAGDEFVLQREKDQVQK